MIKIKLKQIVFMIVREGVLLATPAIKITN